MAALFIGTITGLICAVVAAWLGAPIWAVICVYAVSGVIAALAHAVVLALIEPDLAARDKENQRLDTEVEDPQSRQ
ncbi:hypothetical protein [Paracoccus cavernae]|uniref:hypothetical protein n=1 Tax=Paracoccus cavernae TaxID=1571207 RepID=UPI0035F31561